MQKIVLFNAAQHPSSTASWKVVTDQVMGGQSQAEMHYADNAVQLKGQVSLANNGGFIQIQWPLKKELNITTYTGLYVEWRASQKTAIDWVLKTSQLWLPWQSYRHSTQANSHWQTLYIPFNAFSPYRTTTRLNLKKLTKFSLLAGGQAMQVDLAVKEMGLYLDE